MRNNDKKNHNTDKNINNNVKKNHNDDKNMHYNDKNMHNNAKNMNNCKITIIVARIYNNDKTAK